MEKSERKLILVASLWLKNENIADFEAYERQAARVLEKHGGRIERAVRVEKRSDDEERATPFEIHVVSFPNRRKYADYQSDSETRKLSESRNNVVARTEIVAGYETKNYHESED